MFPQVGDSEIKEALDNTSGNIEVAVGHILDTTSLQTSLHTTPQQVYASLQLCNDIDSDDDFKDLSNIADSVAEHKTEASINNKEPIADVIRKFAEEKLEKDCTLEYNMSSVLLTSLLTSMKLSILFTQSYLQFTLIS